MTYRRAASRRVGRHIGSTPMESGTTTAAARVCANGRTLRNQRTIDSIYISKRKEISMPTLERVVKPRRNRISVEIPKRFGKYTFRIVMIPIVEDEKPKYDFSDLVGRLEWSGDAVKEQRRLRDEW